MAWAEQLPSGRWRGIYRDPTGKRRSAGTHRTEKLAKDTATAEEVKAQQRSWRNPDSGQTPFNDWITDWWPTRTVDTSTLTRDESRLKHRLLPRWGQTSLDEITRHDIRAWAKQLSNNGLAPSTVQRCVHLLSAALNAAVDAELIPANPAARLRLPQPDNQRERYLTRSEAADLLQTLHGQDKAIISFFLGTGMRWGELAGATIDNYDRISGTYRVITVHDASTGQIRDYPKSKKRRTLPIPPWVQQTLHPHIGTRKKGLIFQSATGTPLSNTNFVRRVLKPALAATGIEDVTPHTFRHTYASWLLQDGVSLAEVGRLLGHVSPLTTARYAHLVDEASPQVLESIRKPPEQARIRGANVGQNPASQGYTELRQEQTG